MCYHFAAHTKCEENGIGFASKLRRKIETLITIIIFITSVGKSENLFLIIRIILSKKIQNVFQTTHSTVCGCDASQMNVIVVFFHSHLSDKVKFLVPFWLHSEGKNPKKNCFFYIFMHEIRCSHNCWTLFTNHINRNIVRQNWYVGIYSQNWLEKCDKKIHFRYRRTQAQATK